MSATSPAETIWTEENILSTSRALHQAQNHSDSQVGTYTGPLRGSALVLPSKPEMEDMLSAFFGNTGLVFPFIHETSFMSEYEKARASGFTHLRLSWLGLLNMIFAMTTSVNAPCNDGNASMLARSLIFYERASHLCRNEMLRGTTLETGRLHCNPKRAF